MVKFIVFCRSLSDSGQIKCINLICSLIKTFWHMIVVKLNERNFAYG